MGISKTKLTSKVTQKYQATIPQVIREKLEIEKGDRDLVQKSLQQLFNLES